MRLLPACLLFAACQPGRTSLDEFSVFRGDSLHSGRFDAAELPNFGGLRWRVRLDGPIQGTPAVTRTRVYAGTTRGTLYALDRATGAVMWEYDAGSSIGSAPAIAGGLAIITTRDGRIHGVETAGGRRRWRSDPAAERPFPWGYESGDIYLSSPAVAGDAVYAGRPDGSVVRLDLASGKLRWATRTEGRIRSSPAAAGGVVYVGSADGSIYALAAQSGSVLWRFDTFGRRLESKNFGYDRRTVQSSPAVDSATVYIGARDGFVYAIDRATGLERWRYDHKISWVNASAALGHGSVFTASSDGHFIQALDAATGREQWRVPTLGTAWPSPALVGETLYATEGPGVLYSIQARQGRLNWRYQAPARVFSSPVPADSTVYFGAEDGGLYAVAVTAGPALERYVFWDTTVVDQAQFLGGPAVKRFLVERGYRLVGADSLGQLLRSTSRAQQRSLVFALDVLPASLGDSAASLLRGFLDGGGRVVWLGLPPAFWPFDRVAGGRPIPAIDRGALQRRFGVSIEHGQFDQAASWPTAAGQTLGLVGQLPTTWSADTAGLTPLALDPEGRAGAWIKHYPNGGALVRLLSGGWRDIGVPQLAAAQMAAELMPLPGRQW